MTEWLSTTTLRRGDLAQVAACVGVSARTLRAWRARGACCTKRPGRPPRAASEREQAEVLVRAVFEGLRAGHDGWRSVQAELDRHGETVATRLVQSLVRELKIERAKRIAGRIAANRVHVEVLARDAIWGCDSTLVGSQAGSRIKAVVVRETFVPHTLSIAIGGDPDASDIERQLELTAKVRGGWPLVMMFDNGGENCGESLQRRLAKEQVIVLMNVPRTPQHNPRTEHAIGDLKRAAGLTRAERRADGERSKSELLVRLVDAWVHLDCEHARGSLGGLTPAELDRIAPRADACVRRARFYEDACVELERVRATHAKPRERRRAEREAVWCALERADLVTRTRGGGAGQAFKAEGVS